MITFLKKKDKFISLVLKHIGTSALMDLLLRLVSCVEPAGLRQEVLHVSPGVPPVPKGSGAAGSQLVKCRSSEHQGARPSSLHPVCTSPWGC